MGKNIFSLDVALDNVGARGVGRAEDYNSRGFLPCIPYLVMLRQRGHISAL